MNSEKGPKYIFAQEDKLYYQYYLEGIEKIKTENKKKNDNKRV